jgi:hypothetical protein
MSSSSVITAIESVINTAMNDFQEYLNDLNTYALQRFGSGPFTTNHNLAPPTLEFPDAPSDTSDQVDIRKDRLFDPTTLAPGGWPTYHQPNRPNWDSLFADMEPHVERQWVSSELDGLIAIANRMADGDLSYLTNAFQQNMFDKDRDRRLQSLEDALNAIAARHAAMGFTLPTSMLLAQQNELMMKHQFDTTNESREIIRLVEESARNYRIAGLQQGLQVEQIMVQFTGAYDRLLFEKVRTIVDVYLKEVDTEARSFEAQVKAITLRLEAEMLSWKLTDEYNTTQMNADLYPWKKYEIQVRAAAEKARGQVQLFAEKVKADVQALETGMRSAADTIKAAMVADITVTSIKG